jgi:riboflavin-specific deaminase-like protein
MPEGILQVYPPPTREVDSPYADIELPSTGSHDSSLPYVITNMVTSVDGRVTEAGKASGLGSTLDRRTMRTLRSKADAVMIGAGTLRAERLSLALDDSGLPQPLAVIVTETGEVPLESNLASYGQQTVLVIGPNQAAEQLRGRASVLALQTSPSGAMDLREALRSLKATYGVNGLLVEGGPRLNHSLISQKLADELFLTISPKLLGGLPGEALTMLEGNLLPAETRPAPDLLSVYLAGSELFLRYSLF